MPTKLNPAQRSAVRTIDTPLLVLAGAGSGKTRVITEKVAYLIDTCRIPAKHIAALTFTNKSAREMKERLQRITNATSIRGLRVSTFHTLGLNIIRHELKALNYRSGFSIYDETDSVNLIKEIMRREYCDPGDQAQKIRWRISRWKNSFLTPEQALSIAKDNDELLAAKLYPQYNHHLKTYNAVDFDDLIMLPAQLFRDRTIILSKWREHIRYLLVDEYQDTNTIQYELVKQLVGNRNSLTVVGDDDQSIYAWRGAQPENLALLKNDYPNLRVIKLEQNYRSTATILSAANTLIANNTHVFEKNLWGTLGPGSPILINCLRDEEQEAEQVIAQLLHHQFQKRTKCSDYAILYRGNFQSRLFERVLREHNIPYYLSGGISFFAYAEIKDIMAYLRLITNPDDDNAFLRIANTPRRGIGPGTLESLTRSATVQQCSLFTACWSDRLSANLSANAASKLREFAEWISTIESSIDQGHPIQAVEKLVTEMNYRSWLQDTSKTPEDAERRFENIQELIQWISRLAEQESDSTLGDLVAKLTLMDSLDRETEEETGNRVHLMTLHAAKGLEFPHVFLVGMEENLLPHRSSIEEDNIEEERRLAYVGITRAQQSLTITLAAQRKRYGEVVDCEPSRFLHELPQDILDWRGHGVEVPEAERQERGKAHIANLRDMLSS